MRGEERKNEISLWRRYLPIMIAVFVLVAIAVFVVSKKRQNSMDKQPNITETNAIGTFDKQRKCARLPQFLKQLKIPQPVMIDLSQKQFKGVAFLYGKGFQKTLHHKQWEQYAYFSTYTVDEQGNIYLVPMPFISIHPSTFNLQKNIYKVDSKTGKLSIFMHLEDVHPSANNPYGINAITYDCDDRSLWVAAIDGSNYQEQKGVIYHIDPVSKTILQKIEGIDVLSMTLLQSSKGKYLLIGSARDNVLYTLKIEKGMLSSDPVKLLALPNANEHIRKIKIIGRNKLELQSIPFSYALIVQTDKEDRVYYQAVWEEKRKKFHIQHRDKKSSKKTLN